MGGISEITDPNSLRMDAISRAALSPNSARDVKMLGLKHWLLKEYEKSCGARKSPFQHPNILVDYRWHAFVAEAIDEILTWTTYIAITYLGATESIPLSVLALIQRSNEDFKNLLDFLSQRVHSAFYELSVLALHSDLTLLKSEEPCERIMPAPEGLWTLEAKGASLYYKGAFRLSDINFKLLPGQIYGIHGANGSGKSFLALLLSGLFIPTDGSISINNVDMRGISEFDLIENIVVLWQDAGALL